KFVRLVALLSLAATTLAVLTYTRADPDLWGNVRFGADIVARRGVPRLDPYSFASDRPWINHEWLAEIVMYAAYRAGGGPGLIALKVVLVVAMLAAVVFALRTLTLAPIVQAAIFGFALVATVPQATHVRPQLFSLALFAWLLVVLLRARAADRVPIVTIPILIVWANLHGGWIVGAGALALWAAAGVVGGQTPRRTLQLGVVTAVAIAATVCNPYGVAMWTFLQDTVRPVRADIVDWQPILRLGGMYVLLWALTMMVLVAAAARSFARRSVDWQALAIPLALAVGSFRVNRLLGFFALATAILTAAAFQRDAREPSAAPALAPRSESGWQVAVALAIFSAVCVGGVGVAASNAECVRVDEEFSPERAIVEFVDSRHLHGRMLTWFDWGHYAIWHFADRGVAVSMDGRRETVYSDEVVQDHLRFYFDPNARDAVLARLRPDYIWLPRDMDAVAWLDARGWRPLFSGERSVLLAPPGTPKAAIAATMTTRAPRCFPGP
ncbi:MAG TPA: hypothetical protein VFA27_11355, partial [Vicinamibacterales bacterium]|nr:hypothetical protein [Vicinamibacterales bacterium]